MVAEGKPTADGVAVGTFHHTFHIVVGEIDAVLELVVTALDIHCVLMPHAVPHGLCQPVSVHAAQHLLVKHVVVLIVFVLHGSVLPLLNAVVANIGEQSAVLLHLQFLCCVGKVVAAEVGEAEGHLSRVGHVEAAALWLHGLDDHHAVGCLRTIDGLGGGIFQDGNVLYTVHVHVHHLGERCLEAIDDEQRLVGVGLVLALEIGESRLSSQVDVGQRIGVATDREVLSEVERRIKILQVVQHVGVTGQSQVFLLEDGGRTRKAVRLAGVHTIVDDHHFL